MDELEQVSQKSRELMQAEGQAVIDLLLTMHRRDKRRVGICIAAAVVSAAAALASALSVLL